MSPARRAALLAGASTLALVSLAGCSCGGLDASPATTSNFGISGAVTPTSLGPGTTVFLTGPSSASTTPDAGGQFVFVGLRSGSYTVAPSCPGSTFAPSTRVVVVGGADVAGVDFVGSAFEANLTVDGSRTFQTIDGLGTNVNVESWRGGELAPALDLLVDVEGASLLRVVRDPMDWVKSESDIPALHAKDAATLARIYESPPMKDLWSTLGYLNRKGLGGSKLMVNFMGWTPAWMGGSGAYGRPSTITAGKEAAFATAIASLVYYGRTVKGLDFTLVAPMNEEDLDGKEGPRVNPVQYAAVLEALADELGWYGLGDVRIVGPDTASSPDAYVAEMMASAKVSGRVDHLAFHTYGGATSPVPPQGGKNTWLTETAVWCGSCDQNGAPAGGEWEFARDTGALVLEDLSNGLPAVLVWEGYDSFWYHHDSYSTWGLLAYDRSSGAYAPRKRFYVNSQLTRFIRPGMRRTSVSTSVGGLTALAFLDTNTNRVAIVGLNSGSAPVTLEGQLDNLPALVPSLALFQTDSGSRNLERGPDVPVLGSTFTVTIPADTFFSLAN